MAIRNGITIMMDRARVMKFTMNSLSLAEELTGRNILEMDLKKLGMKDMRHFIFAALLDNDRELTLEKAGDLADEYEGGIGELLEFAAKAMEESFGPASKNVKRPPTAKNTRPA